MSTATPPRPAGPAAAERLEALARFGRPLGFGLLLAAALLLVYPLYSVIRGGGLGLPAGAWFLVVLAVEAAGVAFFNLAYDPAGRMTPAEKLRVVLMTLGGLVGFTFAAYGLLLPFVLYRDVYAGGLKEWRANPGALAWPGLALFGGLALMFVSLQLARGAERASAAMRRLLYGYNAVLGCLLLLIVVVLVNVLTYVQRPPLDVFGKTFDWTSSQLYTLSPATKSLLGSLDQPVKVYVILSGGQLSSEVETLLKNFRDVTDRVSWQLLSRDLNRRELFELIEKYQLSGDPGLLVVYGTEPNAKHDFIKADDLFSDTSQEKTARFAFKGESALDKSLQLLTEGKKPTVYFTQGNGELDFNDRKPDAADAGLGVLHDQLGKGNYVLKELRFEADAKVPEDADVVVVARPRLEVPPGAVKALRDFVNGTGRKAKGKLIVLFDVVTRREGGMVTTGLEALVAEFGVKVNNDRVVNVRLSPPTQAVGLANPDLRDNPISRAFGGEGASAPVSFLFDDVRTVTSVPPAPNVPAAYNASELILLPPSFYPVVETDLNVPAERLAGELRRPDNREQLAKRVSRGPVSVAAAVTEGRPGLPRVPGHESLSHPVMVVFGDASWVTNQLLSDPRMGRNNYDLFASCLAWLRERPDVGGQVVEAKDRQEFHLDAPPDSGSRLLLMPLALILVCVLALGAGVWVVRRR